MATAGGFLMVLGLLCAFGAMYKGSVIGFTMDEGPSLIGMLVLAIVLILVGYRVLLAGGARMGPPLATVEALAPAPAVMREWDGSTIEAALEPVPSAAWDAILQGETSTDEWAQLELAPGIGGQLTLVATVWGQPVALMDAGTLPEHPDLIEAVGGGVNVGVVTITRGTAGESTVLHLGPSYAGRPVPPWEGSPVH